MSYSARVTLPDPVDPYSTTPAGYQPEFEPSYTGYGQPAYPPPPPGYAMPYPGSYGVDAYGRPLSDKSKVVAGVLQLALGGFGAGRFYIGDNRTAVLQLVVTIFTCGVGHIWGIIDGVLLLVNGGVDAQGRILRD